MIDDALEPYRRLDSNRPKLESEQVIPFEALKHAWAKAVEKNPDLAVINHRDILEEE